MFDQLLEDIRFTSRFDALNSSIMEMRKDLAVDGSRLKVDIERLTGELEKAKTEIHSKMDHKHQLTEMAWKGDAEIVRSKMEMLRGDLREEVQAGVTSINRDLETGIAQRLNNLSQQIVAMADTVDQMFADGQGGGGGLSPGSSRNASKQTAGRVLTKETGRATDGVSLKQQVQQRLVEGDFLLSNRAEAAPLLFDRLIADRRFQAKFDALQDQIYMVRGNEDAMVELRKDIDARLVSRFEDVKDQISLIKSASAMLGRVLATPVEQGAAGEDAALRRALQNEFGKLDSGGDRPKLDSATAADYKQVVADMNMMRLEMQTIRADFEGLQTGNRDFQTAQTNQQDSAETMILSVIEDKFRDARGDLDAVYQTLAQALKKHQDDEIGKVSVRRDNRVKSSKPPHSHTYGRTTISSTRAVPHILFYI